MGVTLAEVELRNRLLDSVFQSGSRVDGTNLVQFFTKHPEVTDLVTRLRTIGNVAGMSYKTGEALDEETLVRLLCHQRCADCSLDHSENLEYVYTDAGHISPAAEVLLSGPKAA